MYNVNRHNDNTMMTVEYSAALEQRVEEEKGTEPGGKKWEKMNCVLIV